MLETGAWCATFGPYSPVKQWRNLIEAENNQTMRGTDPIYGDITATIRQTIVPASILTPEFEDHHDVAEDLDLSSFLGTDVFTSQLLKPNHLARLVTLLATPDVQGTRVVAARRRFERGTTGVAADDTLGQFVTRLGSGTGVVVDIIVDQGHIESANVIRLKSETGVDVELTFRKGSGFATIQRITVTRQIRRAITRATFTLAQGDLNAAVKRYERILATASRTSMK